MGELRELMLPQYLLIAACLPPLTSEITLLFHHKSTEARSTMGFVSLCKCRLYKDRGLVGLKVRIPRGMTKKRRRKPLERTKNILGYRPQVFGAQQENNSTKRLLTPLSPTIS